MKESKDISKHVKMETGGIAGDRLKSFIERLERLEADKIQVGPQVRYVPFGII